MGKTIKQNPVFNKQTAKVYSNEAEMMQVETLYNDNYDKVKAFLITRCQSNELIEELLQDLYLKLMAMDDLSIIQNPTSYLIRIAHNLMIDELRRQKRHDKRTLTDSIENLDIIDKKPSLFNETLSIQQLAHLGQALSELNDDSRDVLLLSRLRGLTHTQIAKKYNRSNSWVEKMIVRTLNHCRKKLERFE